MLRKSTLLRASTALVFAGTASALVVGCARDTSLDGPSAHPRPLLEGDTTAAPLYVHEHTNIASQMVMAPRIPSRPIGAATGLPILGPTSVQYVANTSVDARVLVLGTNGDENNGDPSLNAITTTLDYAGIPYDVCLTTSSSPSCFAADGSLVLTASSPSLTPHGRYQAVLLSIGDLAYWNGSAWGSGLSTAQWQQLYDYQITYGVRSAAWYGWPGANYCMTGTGSTGTDGGYHANFTAAGASVFNYANAANGTTIQYAWTNFAQITTGGTPILTDNAGNVLGATCVTPDGRETLALTFDSNRYQTHAQHLGYGLVNWATRGLFVGERHVYLDAQVDDVFIDDDEYPTIDLSADGQGCDPTQINPATGQNYVCLAYRISANDLKGILNWQKAARLTPQMAAFKMDLAFNGWGTTTGAYTNDTLTSFAKNNQSNFKWISHTWDHEDLDAIDYTTASAELSKNIQRANNFLKLTTFSRQDLVTPDVSGSQNPAAMQAMWDNGIRFMVGDTSKPAIFGNPAPNDGVFNALQPGILMIPRRPTNVFYNVTTPQEWVDEFNGFYGPSGTFCGPTHPTMTTCFDHNYSYAEVLDLQANQLLSYLLQGEADPWMFHEANLRWNGNGSLITDVIDAAMAKYKALETLPVVSPTMDSLGNWMAGRMNWKSAGVQATISNGGKNITLVASKAANVPITGLNIRGSETYGGQHIAHVALAAGTPVTFTVQ